MDEPITELFVLNPFGPLSELIDSAPCGSLSVHEMDFSLYAVPFSSRILRRSWQTGWPVMDKRKVNLYKVMSEPEEITLRELILDIRSLNSVTQSPLSILEKELFFKSSIIQALLMNPQTDISNMGAWQKFNLRNLITIKDLIFVVESEIKSRIRNWDPLHSDYNEDFVALAFLLTLIDNLNVSNKSLCGLDDGQLRHEVTSLMGAFSAMSKPEFVSKYNNLESERARSYVITHSGLIEKANSRDINKMYLEIVSA